jgi:hypothetical protein
MQRRLALHKCLVAPDALSSLRPLRLESLGLLDRDGLIDAKIALRCFVANSAIPIEIVALDKI